FVFIAIRALRFDPRFVLSQGLFAAFGWVLMVGYVVHESGAEVITRSFTEYLTSNLVMIGAEFDKIFTILLCTLVLSLALYRARAILLVAVREGAAGRDMRRFFGRGVAEAITSQEEAAMAGDATERDAAVLMLDLRGFTAFAANHDPDAVVEVLTDYHRMAVPIIEAHGGVVDKFLGDGVMATFGALRPCDSAAADALRTLLTVIEAAPAWEAALSAKGVAPLPINGAVAAGRVVAATLGNDARLEFTVIGTPANLAAKLEKHNKVTRTRALTDWTTFSRARAEGLDVEAERMGSCTLAGGGEVDLVKLA
ncbi:MAG: adenylate/guanylate cyclase domain-containing protein, partial [Pseudomonadota bacterium]